MTTRIPASHPRAASLRIRERLADGFDSGLVAREGLMAHGRGEAFDYLLGERTGAPARRAIRAAAAALALADAPVISVNGNAGALCPAEMVALARGCGAALEVNLFYGGKGRRQAVAGALRRAGGSMILGTEYSYMVDLPGTDSERGRVDRRGIHGADVVVVPLEDGDRTAALRRAGKTVIAFDLNPLSRTARTADITIVDNIARAAALLAAGAKSMSGRGPAALRRIIASFDNGENLACSVSQIRDNLERRARGA